jgi:hypothetical protein
MGDSVKKNPGICEDPGILHYMKVTSLLPVLY